ncbi:hypothetical protein LUZ60_011528 [Juncus effusus]|nr:hypothetical protein LUZ60_011528 [Juncus effusus]
MERDSNRKRQLPPLPPAPAPEATAELSSLPARRWRNDFSSIREEINLQASFFRRPESRQDNFRRNFVFQFEKMFRKMVREELETNIYFSNLPPRPPPNQNGQARYKLIITTHIKSPIFTTDTIEPIKIVIYDTYNQSKFSHSSDSLSSAKLKIVVLNAEFWKDEKESWSRDEFNKSILVEREQKGPIFTGETQFRLQNGAKIIKNLVMRDNSSWTKSGFMLGVMIEKEEGFRVLEGLSNPFKVKDRRGKACQKPDKLQLTHKVQSLRKIGKDRASILENYNIKTVQDFLISYHNKQAELREMLGIKTDYDKGWQSIVDHAMECKAEFHNALNCINISPMVLMDEQMIITNRNSHQIQFTDPNNNNFDNLCGSEFGTAQLEAASNNMLVRNMPLDTSNGPHFVSSSLSEPNPFDHNMTIQDKASLFADSCLVDGSNEFGQIAGQQSQFPSNDLQIPNGELNNHMERIFTSHESANPHPFRNNSFDPSECGELVQNFIATQVPSLFSPRKKVTWVDVQRKRAIIKLVTWPARKRARLEPPVWQTELLNV